MARQLVRPVALGTAPSWINEAATLTAPYYRDDKVTLYLGDCREITEWLAADVLVTDPPYGLGKSMAGGPRKWRLWADGDGGQSSSGLAWDREAPDFIPAVIPRFRAAVVWGGNYFSLPPARGWLVWDKIVRQFSSGHCELAWTNLPQPVRALSYSHGQLATEGKQHPTQKPLPLMEWCISMCPPGVIADPFAGSGSTLVAARNLGRQAIGVELEERYCEIAARRLAQDCLDLGSVS